MARRIGTSTKMPAQSGALPKTGVRTAGRGPPARRETDPWPAPGNGYADGSGGRRFSFGAHRAAQSAHRESGDRRQAASQLLHLVVDSTVLKVYGEREWQVCKHGNTKRRTWRKIHVGVDEATGEIVAKVLTANHVGDHEVVPQLVRQVRGRIDQFSGDGGYDYEVVCRTFGRRKTQVTVPPRSNGACSELPWIEQRNDHIKRSAEVGRNQGKQECGYHRRGLAETATFRRVAAGRTIFGDRLSARTLKRQPTEAALRCAPLNRMTHLGMPDSYHVAC